MNKALSTITIVLVLLLAGCDQNEFMRNMMERITPDDDAAFATEYINAMRAQDLESVMRLHAPELNQPGVETNLSFMADLLAEGEPLSVEQTGCNIFKTPAKRQSNLSYQYQFTNSWVLVNVVVDSFDRKKQVAGCHVNRIPGSLQELNAFSFKGKGLIHYCVFAAAIVIPLFMLYVLIVCIRTKMKKRKWLWIIFILGAFGKLVLDWNSGRMSFNPLSIQLLGSGCFKPGLYAPWTVTISFPLGAILFLLRRNKLRWQPETTEPSDEEQIESEDGPSSTSLEFPGAHKNCPEIATSAAQTA